MKIMTAANLSPIDIRILCIYQNVNTIKYDQIIMLLTKYIHCVSKRDPDIIDCNFKKD